MQVCSLDYDQACQSHRTLSMHEHQTDQDHQFQKDQESDTLLITSDHGNLEDSTTQLHTYSPVPLLTWGYKSDELRDKIASLVDVRPAIVDIFVSST